MLGISKGIVNNRNQLIVDVKTVERIQHHKYLDPKIDDSNQDSQTIISCIEETK